MNKEKLRSCVCSHVVVPAPNILPEFILQQPPSRVFWFNHATAASFTFHFTIHNSRCVCGVAFLFFLLPSFCVRLIHIAALTEKNCLN